MTEVTQLRPDVIRPGVSRLRSVSCPVPTAEWLAVTAGDPYALPEHTPDWVAAICAIGPWVDASRLYETADGRRFVLPLVRRRGVPGGGGRASSFPPAWGIGGLSGVGLDAGVVRAVLGDLRRTGLQRISIRPDPMQAAIWEAAAGPELIAVPRRAHVLDLEGGFDAVWRGMKSNTRGYIRRAERIGVEVELDRTGGLVETYYALYLKSLERWAARQHEPVALARWRGRHRDPVRKLAAMAQHLGDRLVIALARVEGEPAFGAIMLLGATAHVTRSAMDVDRAGTSKAGVLVHRRLLELACGSGASRYHLGESGTSRSLAQFKESFGAVGHDYAEYRIERLPYTRADSAVRSAVKRVLGFRDS